MTKTIEKEPANTNDILDVLKAARQLIINPENWTKGAAARNIKDEAVRFGMLSACKFCAVGAVQRALLDFTKKNQNKQIGIDQVYDLFPMSSSNPYQKATELIIYNDEIATHDEIIKIFDLAIEMGYVKQST